MVESTSFNVSLDVVLKGKNKSSFLLDFSINSLPQSIKQNREEADTKEIFLAQLGYGASHLLT